MSNYSLADSIADIAQEAIAATSDFILCIEASRDWPMAEAMRRYHSRHEDLRLFVRRPFNITGFAGLSCTNNPQEVTKWRNTRGRKFHIIIVGAVGGQLESGLKDVKRIDRRKLISNWRENVLSSLPESPAELAKPEVRKLLQELFEMVANGYLAASHLESYLDNISKSRDVKSVCSSLWRVGLIPDPQALDTNMSKRRLARNAELVDLLRTGDDPQIDRRLRETKIAPLAKVAKAAIAFRDTTDEKYLQQMSLPEVDTLLVPSSGGGSKQSADLTELLNHSATDADQVADTLTKLKKKWDLNAVQDGIEATFTAGSGANYQIKISLDPVKQEVPTDEGSEEELHKPWSSSIGGTQVLAAMSSSKVPESLGSSQHELTSEHLISMGFAAEEVTEFLQARKALGEFEPWLENDCIALFLLVPEALEAAKTFLSAWQRLAEAAIRAKDARAFVETVQVLETVSGPNDEAEWILLGPMHPYRLDPVVKAVQQTIGYLRKESEVSRVGDALEWTLDKCFPAYPAIFRGDKTLFLTSASPHVCYGSASENLLPVARESAGLERVTRAIDGFSPWLKQGISVLVIDPPMGGGVAKAMDRLRSRPAGRFVALHHLATNDHTDTLENFDGTVNYLPKALALSAVKDLPQVNLLVRFAPSPVSRGEPYNAEWRATRGTHLALLMEESSDGPFTPKKTTKIKIDPRQGNVVVLLAHQLLAAAGGRPIHATLRPLLETDDAPSLSRLASNTDWVVFAAPGPLGLVAPKTINNTLRYVGRANMGPYGLYVYVADDMFPVRKHFEAYFQKTPMATISPAKMVDLLVEKAQESTDAILFSSVSSVPAQIACLVSLHVAKDTCSDAAVRLTLSLDDLGWTRAWLSRESGLRADFLVVSLMRDGRIVFQVVESKSEESGMKIPCSATAPQFAEAIGQVSRTLAMLDEIATATSPTLDQDLRYTSLIEQLMACAMAASADLGGELRSMAIDAINSLSKREAQIEFRSLVVLTQAGINAPRETKVLDDRISIVWAGNPDVEKTFGLKPGFALTAPSPALPNPAKSHPRRAAHQNTERTGKESLDSTHPADEGTSNDGGNEEGQKESVQLAVPDSPVGNMARSFITAAKLHGIPVSSPDPVYLQAGPAVFNFGVRLREGAKVRDFQARIEDIARDAGLGELGASISIENDKNEPRTVRVQMPRQDREFPDLPEAHSGPIGDDNTYLPFFIGQTIDGLDYKSSLEAWPHMLVAGTSNSGKTTFLKSLLRQANNFGPGLIQTLIVDGKSETDYFGIVDRSMYPGTFSEVQQGQDNVVEVLKWAVDEMETRRKRIVDLAKKTSNRAIKAADLYRLAIKEDRAPDVIPLLIVIDEFAEIMLRGKKEVEHFENLVQRIAQAGRGSLIHIVLATQRPDRSIIRGSIKANLNCRAVFRLPIQADSVTVLGHAGAERLLIHGDMLFKSGPAAATRLQGYRV